MYLFNDVGAEFLYAQVTDMFQKASHEGIGIVDISKVQNILHHIVTKRILHKWQCVPSNDLDQLIL